MYLGVPDSEYFQALAVHTKKDLVFYLNDKITHQKGCGR